MKRTILILGIILSLLWGFLGVEAAITTVKAKGTKEIKNPGSTVIRKPYTPPVDIIFDDETYEIELIPSEYISGEVWICDENGYVYASSPVLDCTLQLPYSATGLVIVSMRGPDWEGSASFII